jgi:YbgC/YbaW family acyl-CoA thioester hydrolase
MAENAPTGIVSLDVPIRWSDLDFLGHVNNAVFLHYLEDARDRVLEAALGSGFENSVIVRIEINYRHEIARGVPFVSVGIQIQGYGRSSVTTQEVITLPDGTIAAEAIATVVVRDPQTLKSRPLTDQEKRGLDEVMQGTF